MVSSIPREERIVAHDHFIAIKAFLMEFGKYLVEEILEGLLIPDNLVVITKNESLLPLKTQHDLLGSIHVAKEYVAQNVDDVICSDSSVPIVDEGFVHLVDIGEWAIAILQNVCVTEVEITCKESIHTALFTRSRLQVYRIRRVE